MSAANKDSSENLLNRREFIAASLITGYALATQPISAQTLIKTDTSQIIAGEVKIPVKDGEIPAYRAMPDKKGKKFPVVLVVHEIFGVHEWIQDICRRFAKAGFMAVAPSLYARQGDVSSLKDFPAIMKIVSKVSDAQVMSDLDATVAFAEASGAGNTKKLSITGFCWGGRIVWLYAAHNRNLDAGAAWYGRVEATEGNPVNALQPTMPIDVAGKLYAPVLGLYGALDKGIPVSAVEEMRTALKNARSKSEIILYPNADHGFLADYRPSYNKESAEDAWQKMLVWFKKHKAI